MTSTALGWIQADRNQILRAYFFRKMSIFLYFSQKILSYTYCTSVRNLRVHNTQQYKNNAKYA